MEKKDIFQGDMLDVDEDGKTRCHEHDVYTQQDLITLFKIREVQDQIQNWAEEKAETLPELFFELNYSYDGDGKRVNDDEAYKQERDAAREDGKKVRESAQWPKEVFVKQLEEKVAIIQDLITKCAIVDRMTFLDEDEAGILKCLWIELWHMENDAPRVHMFASYMRSVGLYEDDDDDPKGKEYEMLDQSFCLDIRNIDVFVVDGTTYTFL